MWVTGIKLLDQSVVPEFLSLLEEEAGVVYPWDFSIHQRDSYQEYKLNCLFNFTNNSDMLRHHQWVLDYLLGVAKRLNVSLMYSILNPGAERKYIFIGKKSECPHEDRFLAHEFFID